MLICCFILAIPGPSAAQSSYTSNETDSTMLMFVGENIEVLSIASRREESAIQAPAVADVITRKEIWSRGVQTLGEALEMVPGFYIAQREWGSHGYLRGIPDSTLFLYDTVPLVLDTDKSLQPLGFDLSLAPVKRIEIIRGPGSVLWGPDAFAGIVNVVPLTGKDLNGFDTGISYGFPDEEKAFFVNAGYDAGRWDAFFSVSGRTIGSESEPVNIVEFWGEEENTAVSFEDRVGWGHPGDAYFLEAFGRVAYEDWLSISGRISGNRQPYGIERSEGDFRWEEVLREPFNFIKLEAKKSIDTFSILRFAGAHTWTSPEIEVIDRSIEQEERTTYGELIYERSFWTGRGLLTGGLSFREKRIQNAPFWSGVLPPFLGPENQFDLAPQIIQEDYTSRLWSVFGQYSYKIGDVDVWLGLRYDAHDPYQDRLSYNIGTKWSPKPAWMFKLLYGTAYRTPYARQLIEEDEPDLENINSISAQVAWTPVRWAGLNLVGFFNRLEKHRMEDPYAGTELSLPNHQDLYGVELEGFYFPIPSLELNANLSLIENDGPDETYQRLKFIRPLPDGTLEKVFEHIEYPFDAGPSTLFNLMSTWRPDERFTFFLKMGYFSSRMLIDPRAEGFRSVSGAWLLDANILMEDIVAPGWDVQISGENLTDRDYEMPGTYQPIDGKPLAVEFSLRKRW